MKNWIMVLLVLSCGVLPAATHAQVGVTINLGAQPAWGPSGYDHAEYYYLPEMETYYYVPRKQFIVWEGNRWVFYSRPPARFRGVNLFNTYKVVVNEPRPYLNHPVYLARYKSYKNFKGRQEIIRDHPGNGNAANGKGNNGNKHGKGNNGKRGKGH